MRKASIVQNHRDFEMSLDVLDKVAATQTSATQPPRDPDFWDVLTHAMWAQPDEWQPLLAGFFALLAGMLAATVGVVGLWAVRYQARRADDRAHKDRLWNQLLTEKVRIEEKIAALSIVVVVWLNKLKLVRSGEKLRQ